MSRERSRSPRDDEPNFPLILQVPQPVFNSCNREDLLVKIQSSSQVRRVHLCSNATSNFADGLIYIYDSSPGNVMRAYRYAVEQLNLDESGRAEVVIHIPDNMVSFIIGKGGRQIFKLQSRSNTEISVLEAVKDIRERQVRIKGRLNDIHQAVEDIYTLILAHRLGFKEEEPIYENAIAKFVIPGNCTGYIIGRGGAFTKQFRTEYRVEIKVIKGHSPLCEEDECIVVLLGRPKDCYYAIDYLVTHISDAVRTTTGAPPKEETKLMISPALAKRLIVSNLALIKEIATKSRSTIGVLNESDINRDKSIVLSIVGPLEARIDATKRILIKLDDTPRRPERPQDLKSPKKEPEEVPKPERESVDKHREGSRDNREKRSDVRKREPREYSEERRHSRESRRRQRSSSSRSSSPRTDICLTVPDELVGRLIGKNGDNVKGIMGKSGCNIKFQKSPCLDMKTPDGGAARLCTFTGTPSRIASGVRLLLENVAKLEADRQEFENRAR